MAIQGKIFFGENPLFSSHSGILSQHPRWHYLPACDLGIDCQHDHDQLLHVHVFSCSNNLPCLQSGFFAV